LCLLCAIRPIHLIELQDARHTKLPTANTQPNRLPGSNLLFGLPVVMDTDNDAVKEGDKVLLKYKGQDLAVLEVDSKWLPNRVRKGGWGLKGALPGAADVWRYMWI